MALELKVRSNLPKVRKRMGRFFNKFQRIITIGLERAGLQLKEIILEKTSKGQKFSGGKFPAYSPQYSELKGKTVVDLQDTNRMLQSIGTKTINKNKVQLYFRNNNLAKRAYWHHTGQGNLPERPFFDFNNRTEKIIRNTYEKYLKQQIKASRI